MTDEEMIADFIARRGVTRCPPGGAEGPTVSVTYFGRNRLRNDWARGKSHSPTHRYHLALAYAKAHELDEPAWTDIKESLLLELRTQGHSYTQCARIMGKNKNSIQARVRYLRLGRRLHIRKVESKP